MSRRRKLWKWLVFVTRDSVLVTDVLFRLGQYARLALSRGRVGAYCALLMHCIGENK